jgi:hypothetical protein
LHILDGISRVGLIGSVVLVDMYLKGDTADELLGALGKGTLIVMWDACVEESQDGIVGPIGAVVAGEYLARS